MFNLRMIIFAIALIFVLGVLTVVTLGLIWIPIIIWIASNA